MCFATTTLLDATAALFAIECRNRRPLVLRSKMFLFFLFFFLFFPFVCSFFFVFDNDVLISFCLV